MNRFFPSRSSAPAFFAFLALLTAVALLCSACSALPAEERSFAVVFGVSGGAGDWTLHARVPTYQTGGGYLTVTGRGDTLPHALADLDAAAPMQLHPGQARMIVLSADTACSADFPQVMAWLTQWRALRSGAYLAVTPMALDAFMQTLEPATGTRLSKSLDVLVQSRLQQGVIPASTLAEVLSMGERQSPVLLNADVSEDALILAGGWPVGEDGRAAQEPLTAQEMQLLSLMQGRLTQGTLSLDEGAVRLTGASADVSLSLPTLQAAHVTLTLEAADSPLTAQELSRAVASACLRLLNRLSALGCDALGLARQAIVHMSDMDAWHALDWPQRLQAMEWAVSVGAE